MNIDTHSQNGMKHVFVKKLKFRRDNTLLFTFYQIFQLVTISFFLVSSVEAHHAPVDQRYLQKFRGFTDSEIKYPFGGVTPNSNFSKQEVLSAQLLKCNRNTVPGSIYRGVHFANRAVRLNVSSRLKMTEAKFNGLAKLGLQYTWVRCPAKPAFGLPSYGNIVIEVWRNNEMIYKFGPIKNNALRDGLDASRAWSKWGPYLSPEHRQAALAKQAEQQRQQQAAQRARAQAKEKRVSELRSTIIFWVVIIVGPILFFKFRGPVMAFYYHNFTRHPAAEEFDEAIKKGKKVDGRSLETQLDQATKASNPIEAKVRAEQAKEMAEKARQKTAEIKAQEELAGAMMDVERARRAERRAREAYEQAKRNQK